MFQKLRSKRKTSPPASDKKQPSKVVPPSLEGDEKKPAEEPSAVERDSASSGDEQQAASRSGATTTESRHKGKEEESGDPRNPRALIAEAVGSHAVTLARTNTILKVATVSLSVLSLVLGVAATVGLSKEPEYRYFFVSPDGTIEKRDPLEDPLLSLNRVRDFYATSLSELFSFHYRNFSQHYQNLAPEIMTEVAMREFAEELERIGLVGSMKNRKEVAEAVILESPVLNASGEDPDTGRYTWEMTVPFNLRLESGSEGRTSVRRMGGVVRVQIIRVEPTENPRQILINRITIRDTTNE